MESNREARLWNLAKTDPRTVVEELQPDVRSEQADPTALYLQGVAYYRLQEWPTARQLLKQAVTQKPAYPHAWYYLGLAAEQQGDVREAIAALRAAAAYRPSASLAPLVQRKLSILDPESETTAGAQLVRPRRRQSNDQARGIFTDPVAQWNVLPIALKAAMTLMGLVVISFLVFVAWSMFGPNGGLQQHRQQQEEIQEMERQQCEYAAERGIELPGC